jgi:hypothetical protein
MRIRIRNRNTALILAVNEYLMIIVLILGWESGPVDQVALVQVQRHAGRPLPQHHAR